MNKKKSINVDDLNNPEDFYFFLDNEPLFDEDLLFGYSNWKLTLRESLLTKSIEIRKKALDRARKIEEIDENNDYEWWSICETLEEDIDQAKFELEEVQNYLARGIVEITPEVLYQEAIRKRREIKIKYLKDISLTVALTFIFCIYAYIDNPWLILLPISIGVIIIFIQILSFDWEARKHYRDKLDI